MAARRPSKASSWTSQATRRGCQQPTFHRSLPYKKSLGDTAIKLSTALGSPLDEWQRDTIRDWLAVDPETKRYIHRRCGLAVPRQNGKTLLIEMRVHIGIALGEMILYTAHDYSTVTQLFDRMKGFYGEKARDPEAKYPELNKMVRSVRKGTGKEAIFFSNGAAIYFSTRTKSAKRGFTVDVVIADEAQELNDSHLKAMLSTASAGPRHNPQYIYCGTPPTPESTGTFFQHLRKTVHEKQPDDLCWAEWALVLDDPRRLEEQIDDEEWWWRTNPALGVRISIETVRSERDTYTEPLSFAQERLCFFMLEIEAEHVISAADWESCTTYDPPADGVMTVGIKFAPDGSSGSLSICIRPQSGKPYIECIDNRSMSGGAAWFERWVVARKDKISEVWVDGRTYAAALAQRLSASGMKKRAVKLPSTSDVVAANSMLVDAVSSGAIEHYDQEALADSATLSAKRTIGKDGFGFDSTQTCDATLIESCALAHRAAMTTRRKPSRKAVVR